MMGQRTRRWLRAGLYTIAITAGLLVGARFRAVLSAGSPVAGGLELTQVPTVLDTVAELALVYVGSSSCTFSDPEVLRPAISDVRDSLEQRGAAAGYRVKAIGVSVDNDVGRGVQHLEEVAEFDEIVVGNGWQNLGSLNYVFGELGGEPATPQLLVVRRVVQEGIYHAVLEEELLGRHTGLNAIRLWLSAGIPVALEPSKSLRASQAPLL